LIASGFTAVYAIRLFNRVGFGRLDNAKANWSSTRWPERAPALVLTLLILACGLWPKALTGWSEASTASLALRSSSFPSQVAASPSLSTAIASAPHLLPS
jgi:NAD(P)H-quinone oxidoreductase subunit 4